MQPYAQAYYSTDLDWQDSVSSEDVSGRVGSPEDSSPTIQSLIVDSGCVPTPNDDALESGVSLPQQALFRLAEVQYDNDEVHGSNNEADEPDTRGAKKTCCGYETRSATVSIPVTIGGAWSYDHGMGTFHPQVIIITVEKKYKHCVRWAYIC